MDIFLTRPDRQYKTKQFLFENSKEQKLMFSFCSFGCQHTLFDYSTLVKVLHDLQSYSAVALVLVLLQLLDYYCYYLLPNFQSVVVPFVPLQKTQFSAEQSEKGITKVKQTHDKSNQNYAVHCLKGKGMHNFFRTTVFMSPPAISMIWESYYLETPFL